MRVNRGQAFVIAGYTPASRNFDTVIFGYYDGGKLVYAGRTRNGFTPSSRDQLFRRFKALAVEECPFANLPEARGGRWDEGLTAEKMKVCQWLLCRIRHRSHGESTISSCLEPFLARNQIEPLDLYLTGALPIPVGEPDMHLARSSHNREFRYIGQPQNSPGAIAVWHLWLSARTE
jgi:hypothetical protein